MKITTIIGARPQFIKAAAVSREINKRSSIKEIIIHTGQHYDTNMSEIFFKEMEIPPPDHFLNINGLNHGAMTGQMLEKIETLLLNERPDYVLVYGDTNTTLAGALAATKLHFPVAHIEAGLRSSNMKMPEEINRILTDRISHLLFCPTESAISNLNMEGFSQYNCKIIKCGDVMQDAAMYYSVISENKSQIIRNLELDAFVLCTIHRAENTDNAENLKSIFSALESINREIPVLVPLHPRTRKILDQLGMVPEVRIIEPVGYFDMLELIKHCSLVMTDSGGLQKEAFFFKKHCVTIREETEWVELVEHEYNVIAGSGRERIYKAFRDQIHKSSDFEVELYGNGKASEKIVRELMNNV